MACQVKGTSILPLADNCCIYTKERGLKAQQAALGIVSLSGESVLDSLVSRHFHSSPPPLPEERCAQREGGQGSSLCQALGYRGGEEARAALRTQDSQVYVVYSQ